MPTKKLSLFSSLHFSQSSHLLRTSSSSSFSLFTVHITLINHSNKNRVLNLLESFSFFIYLFWRKQNKNMRKTYVSSSPNSFGGFLSPGAPSYTDNNNKGWSSERVPHPSSSSTTAGTNSVHHHRRRIGSASALTTPFYSGRSIPSKWEDAERWICSPAVTNPHFSHHQQRRQKSKSGPIVPPPPPPTLTHQRMMMMMNRAVEAPQGNLKKGLMTVGSPFSTGVLEAERVFRGSVGGGGGGHGHSQSCADLMSEEETSSSLSSKTDTGNN